MRYHLKVLCVPCDGSHTCQEMLLLEFDFLFVYRTLEYASNLRIWYWTTGEDDSDTWLTSNNIDDLRNNNVVNDVEQ